MPVSGKIPFMEHIRPKTFYIKTYGCQANEADSNTISGVLEALDYTPVDEPPGKNEDEVLQKVERYYESQGRAVMLLNTD